MTNHEAAAIPRITVWYQNYRRKPPASPICEQLQLPFEDHYFLALGVPGADGLHHFIEPIQPEV